MRLLLLSISRAGASLGRWPTVLLPSPFSEPLFVHVLTLAYVSDYYRWDEGIRGALFQGAGSTHVAVKPWAAFMTAITLLRSSLSFRYNIAMIGCFKYHSSLDGQGARPAAAVTGELSEGPGRLRSCELWVKRRFDGAKARFISLLVGFGSERVVEGAELLMVEREVAVVDGPDCPQPPAPSVETISR